MKDIIEHLNKCFKNHPGLGTYEHGWNDAMEVALSHIESYDPWHKWPEEKPTEGKYITAFEDYVREGWYNTFTDDWYDIEDCPIDVTHWQELPSPPKDTQ